MVFQDPFSSINPAYRVSHGIVRGHEAAPAASSGAASASARSSGCSTPSGSCPPRRCVQKFPYELSGGQRQRVGFAQALAFRPKLILADEPVSMLDVSIRIGMLNLMADLREREGVSFLYITHDVASARYIADRVLVMYAGHLVEEGPTEDVLQRPDASLHPAAALGGARSAGAELGVADATDVGEPPKVIDPKEGCRFRRAARSRSPSARPSRRCCATSAPAAGSPATSPRPTPSRPGTRAAV